MHHILHILFHKSYETSVLYLILVHYEFCNYWLQMAFLSPFIISGVCFMKSLNLYDYLILGPVDYLLPWLCVGITGIS